MRRYLCFLFMIFNFCWLSGVRAELTADEIVLKANQAAYYQGKDGRADVDMVITDSLGRTRERSLTILRENASGGLEQKYYVYFHRPADVKDMAYIVWKHVKRDDDRWLYLPAMDLVRRIASSDKRSSFAGTTFLYEDISGRSPEEDRHELVKSDGGRFEIKNTPKDPNTIEFSYYNLWIDKNNFLPVKAEYYDKQGVLYRRIEALEIKEIQGFPTVVKMKAEDLNSNSHTVSAFKNVKYDVGLSQEIFNERYLRRPPMQWIQG
ncbi:MAG: outer membrane lipoprotein-sorting protein [Candidatus Omnitrophica bacterium]|nr:outer membrane lipoprotein-sorting protein [Candidatus Omnitrophota bacterium]MDD5513349.1 outer membrane lipoprotein-sorting protein [Candidatus Omnitrophota bacterium]